MCLKTFGKIGKDKEKNHTCKLTSNLEGKTPYIHVRHAFGMRRLCSGTSICQKEGSELYPMNDSGLGRFHWHLLVTNDQEIGEVRRVF